MERTQGASVQNGVQEHDARPKMRVPIHGRKAAVGDISKGRNGVNKQPFLFLIG